MFYFPFEAVIVVILTVFVPYIRPFKRLDSVIFVLLLFNKGTFILIIIDQK